MKHILTTIVMSGMVVGAFLPSAVRAEEKPMGTESVPVVYGASATNQSFLPKLGANALVKIEETSSQQIIKQQELWDPFAQQESADTGLGAQALAEANDDAEANERLCPHYHVPGRSSLLTVHNNTLTVLNTGEVRGITQLHVERDGRGTFEVHILDNRNCIYAFSGDTRSDALVLWDSLIELTWNTNKSMTLNVTGEHPHYDKLKVDLKGSYFPSR